MASAAEEAEAKRVREEGWRAAARQRCALLVFFSISPSLPPSRETTGRHSPGAPEEREIEGRSKRARCNAFPNSHSTSGLRRSFRLLQLAERAETSERRRRRRRSMSAAPRSTKRERERRRRGGTTINQAGERTGGRARKTFLPPNSRSRLGKFNLTGSATNCDPCSLIFALWFCQSSNSGFAQFSYFRKREK